MRTLTQATVLRLELPFDPATMDEALLLQVLDFYQVGFGDPEPAAGAGLWLAGSQGMDPGIETLASIIVVDGF